jgi:hypothetical protein
MTITNFFLTDVQTVVKKALVGRKLTCEKLGPRHQHVSQTYVKIEDAATYHCGDSSLDPASLYIAQSNCPGGAWNNIGYAHIYDDHVKLNMKTIYGIFHSKSELEEFIFQYCDPEFPDNILSFLHRAALNARMAWNFQDRRYWRKRARNLKPEVLTGN